MARWPANEQPLAPLFDDRVSIDSNGFIPCGVCSVRIGGRARHDQSFAWAICPHRLLTFSARGFSDTQRALGRRVLNLAGFETGDKVNVWSEVTLRDDSVNINYRLDYVLRRADCDDPPIIVEVMTASTSGGNRSKRTDIKSAFCNAVLHANRLVPDIPVSPGVNVRQVWARMASQLIVKSEIANAWGGRTIWVVQDTLIDYIRRNTGLPLDQLRPFGLEAARGQRGDRQHREFQRRASVRGPNSETWNRAMLDGAAKHAWRTSRGCPS